MKYTSQYFLFLIFFVCSNAKADLPPKLDPPLDSLTVYSGAAVVMGINSIINGNVQAMAAGNIGANTTIGGNLHTAASVTLSASAKINGDLTAGAAISVGKKSVIIGNLTSGSLGSTDIGEDAIIGGNAQAGTALTLGENTTIGGNVQAGIGALTLGINAKVIGDATAGTTITLGTGATVGGTTTQRSPTLLINAPIEDQRIQLEKIKANLAAIQAPSTNELPTAMTLDTKLDAGIYHATALSITAGITITFDGKGQKGHWLINSDSFFDFAANTTMVLLNVTADSTITWNAASYTATGENASIIGTFFASSYILTGQNTMLEGIGDACGGLFTTTGAVTLGASNIIGALNCKLTPTPLLEYRFEEASWNMSPSEILDNTGNGYHAQVNNNSIPQTITPALTGDPGTCGYASQNDGAIQVTGLPLDTSTIGVKTTVTFWMNWDGTTNTMPIGWRIHDIWIIDGSIGFNTGNNDIYGVASAGLAKSWHHIAVEFTNGSVTSNRIHIDGVEQELTQRRNSPNNNRAFIDSELRIGGWSINASYDFHGLMDEVRVYQSALTTEQVATIMAERHPCRTITPAAEYHFDEQIWSGNAGEVVDEIGNFSAQAINGALTASVTAAITGDPGTCRYGSFDGVDDYVVLPDSFENLTDSFTVTAWINPSNVNAGSRIFIDDEKNTRGFGFSLGDPGNGKLRFYARSVNPVSVDTTTSIPVNTWTFVAAVHNSLTKTRQIFINGEAQTITGGLTSNTYSGTWGEDTGPTTIGGETDLGEARNRFTGDIDEVKVYREALTTNEISTIYRETHACSPVIHHYEIVHDGQGLTCDTESVTIKACLNDSCSTLSTESVTLDFIANSTVISSPTFSGSTIVNVDHTVVETLTFSLANATIEAANPVVCDDNSSNSCDMAFTDAGFRFLSGTANNAIIPNQTAGSVFAETLKIQAVKNTNGVCSGLFNNDIKVGLSQENVDPGGSSGLSFSVNNKDIAKHSNATDTLLNFGANSIATIPTPIYNDAGKIRLHANYDIGGITLSGSSNSFWVSPAKLMVSAKSGSVNLNGASATATTTYPAGENFTLTVTAYNAASPAVITPNYLPGQIALKLNRIGPTLADSVNGNLDYKALSHLVTKTSAVFQNVTLNNFLLGSSIYSAAQYSEVGLLNLDVQDSNYGNAGVIIPSEAINIGRFIPHHFSQTVADDGYFIATCNTGKAFAYSGQKDEATNSIGAISYLTNPVLAITAYNKQDNITHNYFQDSQGSDNDYMKLIADNINITTPILDQLARGINGNRLSLTANINTGTLSQIDLTQLPSVVALPKGVLHYRLSDDDHYFYNRSANALVQPFTSDIVIATASIIDTDAINVTTTVDALPTGVEIRYGRLVLENSFGSETSNIKQPMKVQHFDGSAFITSLNNNCAGYNDNNISLTDISLDPALTNVQGGTGDFVAGKTQDIELAAPGANNQGQIGVSYDAYEWLEYDWNNDGLYNNNPTAVATFGIFRGNDRIISWQEVFN